MNMNEAISDSKRPLSITPKEWMMAVEASLAEEQDLTENVIKRIVAKKNENKSDDKKDLMISGVETIDMGVDQIIQGIKLVYEGVKNTDKANLQPEMRKSVNGIKDIMDTAIVPYIKDVCEYSEQFEDNDEKD